MGTETRGECSPTTLTGEGVPRLTRRGRESATNALVLDCSFSRFRPKTEGKARSRREPPKERELRLPAIAYPKQSRMVDGPVLASLIPTSGSGKQGASAQTFLLQPAPAFFSGVAVLVATLLFFFWEISALEHVMLRFPLAGILLPVSGIGALALVLPMFVFLCFKVSLFPGGRLLALPLDLLPLTPSFSQNDFLNT